MLLVRLGSLLTILALVLLALDYGITYVVVTSGVASEGNPRMLWVFSNPTPEKVLLAYVTAVTVLLVLSRCMRYLGTVLRSPVPMDVVYVGTFSALEMITVLNNILILLGGSGLTFITALLR